MNASITVEASLRLIDPDVVVATTLFVGGVESGDVALAAVRRVLHSLDRIDAETASEGRSLRGQTLDDIVEKHTAAALGSIGHPDPGEREIAEAIRAACLEAVAAIQKD